MNIVRRRVRSIARLVVGAALLALATAAPALAQWQELHGADAMLVRADLVVAWAILRAPVDDDTEVVVRVVARHRTYPRLSAEAVDPFTGTRRTVADGVALAEAVDVRWPRKMFAALPRLELLLYRTEDAWRARRPALTVFYLGVPDTAPEFTSENALRAYLADAIARAVAR